jgi:hypothetical protein
MILENNNYRAMLGKEFSQENPYSNIIASVYKTVRSDDLMESNFVQDENDEWWEQRIKVFSESKQDEMRHDFAKNVFEKS